jgi:hypothetical protein
MAMSIALRAQITIDLLADDFVCAADHQRRIEGLMGAIKNVYGEAALEIRERRPRPERKLKRVDPSRQYPAAAEIYEDL